MTFTVYDINYVGSRKTHFTKINLVWKVLHIFSRNFPHNFLPSREIVATCYYVWFWYWQVIININHWWLWMELNQQKILTSHKSHSSFRVISLPLWGLRAVKKSPETKNGKYISAISFNELHRWRIVIGDNDRFVLGGKSIDYHHYFNSLTRRPTFIRQFPSVVRNRPFSGTLQVVSRVRDAAFMRLLSCKPKATPNNVRHNSLCCALNLFCSNRYSFIVDYYEREEKLFVLVLINKTRNK